MKDVLTGEGPDIWCTRRGSLGPSRPVWSGWRTSDPFALYDWDNCGYYYERIPDFAPFAGANRPPNVKYDFKTRKYRVPDFRAWSDARYSEQSNDLMYHRDAIGRKQVELPWWFPWGNRTFDYDGASDNGWDGDEMPDVY